MYDFYEEPRHLNIKKVVIVCVIAVAILLIIIFAIARKISSPNNKEKTENQVTQENHTTTFSSNDNSIRVELSKNLNLTKYDSDYLLELRSENNLDIFISKKDKITNRDLLDIVNADKVAFLRNFESSSNVAEVKELSVNNNLAYTYSFHYLDSNLNKAFYLQIVWIEMNDNYYIFDIEFPLDDLSFYTDLVTSVLASFQVK